MLPCLTVGLRAREDANGHLLARESWELSNVTSLGFIGDLKSLLLFIEFKLDRYADLHVPHIKCGHCRKTQRRAKSMRVPIRNK